MTTQKTHHGLIRSIVLPLILLALALGGWYYVVQDDTPPLEAHTQQVQTRDVSTDSASRKKREKFYNNQVEPELDRAARRNREALANLTDNITAIFKDYKRGVKPFTEDLTSMSTRFWVLWKLPGSNKDVHRYVRSKFEKHLFTRKQLHQDIQTALKGYKEEVMANRNRLLSNVRAAVRTGDVRIPHLPDLDEYSQRVTNNMETYVTDKATDSALNGVTTLVVGEVIAFVGEKIAYAVIVRVGSTAVTSAAATGGASATGAGAGGAAGSTLGPAGTAVGIGVGFAIGAAIDWYMTKRFRAKLQQQMTTYLDDIKQGLIEGVEKNGETTPGIKQVLGEYTDTMNRAQRKQMRIAITGENQ